MRDYAAERPFNVPPASGSKIAIGQTLGNWAEALPALKAQDMPIETLGALGYVPGWTHSSPSAPGPD